MRDFYDDERRIKGIANYVTALVFLGTKVGKKSRYKVKYFTGVRTLGHLRLKEDKTETFIISFHVSEGKAKLVLVNENGIQTLVENHFEGVKQVFLPKGKTRIRLVGSHAFFELSLERK